MKKLFLTLLMATTMLLAFALPQQPVTVKAGDATIQITFFTPDIVHVVKVPDGTEYNRKSLSVIAQPEAVKLNVSATGAITTIKSSALTVKVNSDKGTVDFFDKKGNQLLAEKQNGTFTPFDDAGRKTFAVSQDFVLDPDEEIFGLGILQNGKMSQRGENRKLHPANTEDGIPFFQSIKGYGVFWDNCSTISFEDSADATTFGSEVADAIDYYFIYGANADGVIAGIRHLTGDVPMAPLWTYGFHQSKERYKSQEETVGVLHRYREAGIPIDCMIQDWQYWGNNYLWNAMEFLNETFPNPQAMLKDIHDNNAHCMISIWSSFGPMTKPYKELEAKGLLFDIETWPQSGISHIWPPRPDYPSGVRVYDCYSSEARDIYWNNLKRLYDLGLDAWWMDSTEPDHFNWKEEDFDHQTAMGSYRSVRSAFPLMTVGGVYDHQRAVSDSTRVFILTRSGFFGQQRYGSNVWSGDVVSTWDMLRRQIPAGLNFSLTGNPNFNSDLGGFFAGSYNNAWMGKPAYENPAYRELYTRWMQQGIFTPMMRSHGADVPRELYYYGKPGEPIYDALLDAIKLRYRLLPYIYSTAWQVSNNQGTFMRALAMDFASDKKAVNTPDQYMFGQSILATPVVHAQFTPEVIRHDVDANAGWDSNTGRTTMTDLEKVDFAGTRQHSVYLPAGADWYYFNDNKRYAGGQDVDIDITIGEIPFFVKAGSILPIGPDVQYTSEKPWDNLTILVYPGANATFTLYEDEGDNYNYEKGAYTEIPMSWNDKSRTLTIGARKGAYDGMLDNRQFTVKLIGTDKTQTIPYSGKAKKVRF